MHCHNSDCWAASAIGRNFKPQSRVDRAYANRTILIVFSLNPIGDLLQLRTMWDTVDEFISEFN